MKPERWAYALAWAIALGICAGLVGINVLTTRLEDYLHIDDCLVAFVASGAWLLLWYVWRRVVRGIWLAMMTCALFGYVAFRLHHELAHRTFIRIACLILLFYVADGPWRKKLWGRIKSAGLTAINAASFKRQTKQAFQ